MKLYEIENELRKLLEQTDENGELIEGVFEQIAELKIAEHEKIENTALYYKNLTAEAKAIKEEEDSLRARRKSKENLADKIKGYLDLNLAGQRYESSRVVLSYRKSTAVNVEDENLIPAGYREAQPDKILKAEISKALKAGEKIAGAVLVENQNLQIK